MSGNLKDQLHILIVNFRTPGLTSDCLRTLAECRGEVASVRVIVVENCSGDDSEKVLGDLILANGWSDWACVVRSEKNLGFAGGNNFGHEEARRRFGESEYVLLLNSDTLLKVGALRNCLETMQAEPTIGALSCMLHNGDGSVQNVCRKFPSPMRAVCSSLGLPWKLPALFSWADTDDLSWDRKSVKRDVDWLGGAFLFIRGDLVKKIGLLDSDFFFYGEDIEFCFRVWKAGYRCHFNPATAITHLGGSSSDPSKMLPSSRSAQRWSARYMVQRKCYGRVAASVVRLVDRFMWESRKVWRRWRRGEQDDGYLHALAIASVLRETKV